MRRWLWRFTGYGAAAIVAGVIAAALLVGWMTGAGSLPANALSAFAQMLLLGIVLTASFGFPGWLVCLLVAAWRNRAGNTPGVRFFVVSGGLDGVAAINVLLFGTEFISGGNPWSIAASAPFIAGLSAICLVGGLAGGRIYWQVAARREQTA